MDFQNIYIPHEIIDIIFQNMDYLNKKNFILINKYLYKKYNKKIHFYRLDIYLNNDYKKFYLLLNYHDYKEDKIYLEKVLNLSINNLQTVWKNDNNGYFDLRFLFELIYKHKRLIKNLEFKNPYKHNNHIIIAIINTIILSIKSTRKETLNEINNNSYLSSLKNDFNPKSIKNKKIWMNLIN